MQTIYELKCTHTSTQLLCAEDEHKNIWNISLFLTILRGTSNIQRNCTNSFDKALLLLIEYQR